MKCLAILLVVSVPLCVSVEKKEKRGINHEHGYAAATPLHAAPLPAAHFHAAELPSQPLFAAAPDYAAQQHFAAEQLPLAHDITPMLQPSAGYAVQAAPAQVQTIVKQIAVPHEHLIPIDNPVPFPVERPVPIDNPVPHVKLVEQPVPIHVDVPITVPIVKQIQVPQPHVHHVKLLLQKVLVQQPAAPQKYIVIQQNSRSGHHGWGWD